VVNFMPRPLYPQGKSPRYPLDRRLGGPHNRSGRCAEEKNSQPPPGIELRLLKKRFVHTVFLTVSRHAWPLSLPTELSQWFIVFIHLSLLTSLLISFLLSLFLYLFICFFFSHPFLLVSSFLSSYSFSLSLVIPVLYTSMTKA
jgi:hypothetical protein